MRERLNYIAQSCAQTLEMLRNDSCWRSYIDKGIHIRILYWGGHGWYNDHEEREFLSPGYLMVESTEGQIQKLAIDYGENGQRGDMKTEANGGAFDVGAARLREEPVNAIVGRNEEFDQAFEASETRVGSLLDH
ncbi:hypothetical protein BGZ51_008212 [Haplosporangium sp. Z 767]|nr:hypothetical protein BGZ50_004842 [Haplosporangium sp. Z 11]KAF9190810.1 hypothetical protein BGZ51_008212 [Haplosporangium sp. Z 767]